MGESLTARRKRPADTLLYGLVYFCAFLSVALLALILIYVVVRGVGSVNWQFLTTVTSKLKGTVGIAGNLLNTLMIVVLTMLVALPVGVGAAVYLNEYAKPGKLVSLIEFATETLSGIPSILFGLFGSMFFGETLHLGYSLLTGALTLTLMVLPLITRNTQEALKTVPDSYRHGAVGLGGREVVHHPHHSAPLGHARHPHRRHSGCGPHCGRVCRPALHRRRCQDPAQDPGQILRQDLPVRRYADHSAVPQRHQ